MEESNSSNCSLIIFFIISGILSLINGYEIYNNITKLNNNTIFFSELFDKCIKSELIIKTVFSLYSFFASFSAFTLTSFIYLDTNYFMNKLSGTYLKLNYYIFGPLLLTISIMGFINLHEVIYLCDKNKMDYNNKVFSLSNFLVIIFCFSLSFIFTILVEFFAIFTIIIDSILRKNSGNQYIGTLFWYYVNKFHLRRIRFNSNLNTNNISENLIPGQIEIDQINLNLNTQNNNL